MAYISLEALWEVFGDYIISRGPWPPRSPDLAPCDFYFWGRLKDKMHLQMQSNATIHGGSMISPDGAGG
jgi:hypothetical protein